MTSRERVIAAINHQQPDRVPSGLRFMPEVQGKLAAHFGVHISELDEVIGNDLVTVRPTYPAQVTDVRYADPTIEINSNGELLDIWRVPFRKMQTGLQAYVELAGKPPLQHMQTVQELDNFPWPKAIDWDYSNIERDLAANSDKATWGHSRGFFEISHFMRGMDTFLIDLMQSPQLACRLMDHIGDYLLAKAERILEAANSQFVFFEYNDDVAHQQGLMLAPAVWRRTIKPRMARFCELYHHYGAKVRYHCCGSCYEIIPDLIEIGVDILNPVQPLATNMDPFKLKKEYGRDLCFHGGVDTQQLLPKASPREVYNQVCRLIEKVGKDGGYILGGGHIIQADVPLANVLAMINAAKAEPWVEI